MFTVTVYEHENTEAEARIQTTAIKRYEQTVDDIDLPAVMAAVNRKKRAPRTPKVKPQS